MLVYIPSDSDSDKKPVFSAAGINILTVNPYDFFTGRRSPDLRCFSSFLRVYFESFRDSRGMGIRNPHGYLTETNANTCRGSI